MTTDLLTGRGETYQVALPPDSHMTTKLGVMRQLQGAGVIRLRSQTGQEAVLQADNLVVKASAPHEPNYDNQIWEYDW